MSEKHKIDEFEKRNEWTTGKLDNIIPWLVGAGVALTSQWAAPAIQHLIEGDNKDKIGYDISYIIIFAILLFWFSQITKQHFKARTKELKEINNPSQCSHLVLFLSTARPKEGFVLKNNGIETLKSDLNTILESKNKAIKNNERPTFWAWEMPLRAILYHMKNRHNPILKEIIIVCSNESLEQYPEFEKILNGYLKQTQVNIKILLKAGTQETSLISYKDIEPSSSGIDFEDFDDLSKHLHNTITKLTKQGIKREEIMIDFTGGQKVTSVVAATLTFNSNIKAQYISTKTLQIKGYDIVYGTVQIPELS